MNQGCNYERTVKKCNENKKQAISHVKWILG